MHHIVFVHLSVDGCLGWVLFPGYSDSIAINMHIQVTRWYIDLGSFAVYSGLGIAGSYGESVFFFFSSLFFLVSMVAAQV